MADLNQFLIGGEKYFKPETPVFNTQIVSYTVPTNKLFYATFIWDRNGSTGKVELNGTVMSVSNNLVRADYSNTLQPMIFPGGTVFSSTSGSMDVTGFLGTIEDL